MQKSKKIIPVKVNTDLSSAYLDEFTSRYIKNCTTSEATTDAYSDIKEGNNAASLKRYQSNELYVPFNLPEGQNYCIGAKGFAVTNEVYVFIYNSNLNHSIFRVNGSSRTTDLVYQNSCLNFQLNPEYFVASIVLIPVKLTDPDTNETVTKRDLYWCDGFNDEGYLRVDDAINSNGFDANTYPYFKGNYDVCDLIRVGFNTPDYEIKINEIAVTDADKSIPNQLLFEGFQFRIKDTNVFGVPSEHGIISDLYISQVNDCMQSGSRCLKLVFDAGTPFTDSVDIEYRIGNSTQWYKDDTLFLYQGSTVGNWWERVRNPNITYNASDNTITYIFCNNGERNPIATEETNRIENPIPQAPQVLFELNQKLALVNFKKGFSPFGNTITDKCKLSLVTTPTTIVNTRQIVLYVPIMNFATGNFNPVKKDGTNGYVWGDSNGARAFSQYFKNIYQSGFIGYLNDGNVAVSEQVYWNGSSFELDTSFNGQDISPTGLTLQRFTFNNVAAGIKVFRLASHLYDPTTGGDFQSTSTTVWGVGNYTLNDGNLSIPDKSQAPQLTKEFVINVCNADYDSLKDTKMLVIADLCHAGFRATSGYIYGTTNNGYNEEPMELMKVSNPHGDTSMITDHNGFYWIDTKSGSYSFAFNFLYNCTVAQFNLPSGGANSMGFTNIIIDKKDNHWRDFEALPCNRIKIQGRIILNGKNIGIPNIPILLTRGGNTTSNDDGTFSLICHDDMFNQNVRADSLIIGGGACSFTGLFGSCILEVPLDISRCTLGCQERIYDIGDIYLEYQSFKSLLSGGKYAGALIGHDGKRVTYAQPIGILETPSVIETQNISVFQPKIDLTNGVTFPKDLKYLTVALSKELSIDDYITWVVDKAEFVDNTLAINNYSPSQIRIWYKSLNQFNANNNYNTTTDWSFVTQGTQQPVVGDRVFFEINGDGKFFSTYVSAIVKYDTIGEYFLIDYQSELKNLKANALIRIYRPKQINNTEVITYFEVPNSRIDLVNGTPQKTSALLNYYDTYFLSRQIPVPTLLTTTPIITTINNTTTTGTITTSQIETLNSSNSIVALRNFGLRFESKSPSNIWGKNINNQGRIYTKNEYEQVLHKINTVAITGTLSINGVLNYMQYFDENLMTDFDVKNTLGISGAIAEVGQVFFITPNGNFKVGFNDNLLRLVASGNVQVPSGDSVWGRPQKSAADGEYYGCQYKDKNSIQYYNGFVHFVDRNRCEILQYNFSSFRSLTKDETLILPNVKKGKIDSTFRAKLKAIAFDKRKYFIGGINPLTEKYLVTDFSLDFPTYINQDRQPSTVLSDTIVFDINTGDVDGFVSFTPEMYAWLDGDILNKQLFSFKNAEIFSHNNIFRNDSFNNFFGVQCESVIEIVFAGIPQSQMFFLSLSNWCKQNKFFADRIITQTGQSSYLLLDNFVWHQFFSSAGLLKDVNTLTDTNTTETVLNNIVSEGNPLYGQWIQIRLISDPASNNNYMEYMGSEINFFESKRDAILDKGQLSAE